MGLLAMACATRADAEQTGDSLKLIVDATDRLCRERPLEHSKQGVSLNAEGKAAVGGIFGKVVDANTTAAANFSKDISNGIVPEDLLKALEDQDNCKIKVLMILQDKLLVPSKPEAQRDPWMLDAKITTMDIPNADGFCGRLKALLLSARKNFKGDIVKASSPVIGMPLRHKIELPNTSWCAMNFLPAINGGNVMYYSCSLFYDEKSADIGYSKYSAYQALISKCLGPQWVASPTERRVSKIASDNKGAETMFKNKLDDPSMRLNTRDGRDGIGMYIEIAPPYAR